MEFCSLLNGQAVEVQPAFWVNFLSQPMSIVQVADQFQIAVVTGDDKRLLVLICPREPELVSRINMAAILEAITSRSSEIVHDVEANPLPLRALFDTQAVYGLNVRLSNGLEYFFLIPLLGVLGATCELSLTYYTEDNCDYSEIAGLDRGDLNFELVYYRYLQRRAQFLIAHRKQTSSPTFFLTPGISLVSQSSAFHRLPSTIFHA